MSALEGSIASFDQADAVGSIRLDDGREVRFGKSACPFEPVVGARVEVLGTTPGLRGTTKATAVRLLEDRATHASRLGARDAERGARPPTLPAAEHAATARELGALTILFDDEVPRELGQLLRWMLGFGLEQHGITVETEGSSLVFVLGGVKVRALVGHDPYPVAELSQKIVGPSFSTGRSALTLLFRFMPRAYFTKTPDAWLPTGHARVTSKIAKALLERGRAVIVHRAGELAMPGRSFVGRLGDLEAPDSVPFTAWFDLVNDGSVATTRGLRAFGLPEVRVEHAAAPGTWESARRFEAALFASYCLCRGMWIENGLFEVPRRIQIGATPAQLFDPVDVERWDALATGGELTPDGTMVPIEIVLRHRADSDDAARLFLEGRLGFGGYEALYVHGLMSWLRLGQVDMMPVFVKPVPHRVVTFLGDGPHVLLSTTGIGRVPQPGGELARGDAHVEVAAFVDRSTAHVVEAIVEAIGAEAHRPDRVSMLQPWRIFRTQLAPFLLRPWGPIAMGGGPTVTMLELVPLDATELAWVEAHPQAVAQRYADYDGAKSAERWARVMARR